MLESIEMAEVLQIALKAGRAVMEIYEKDFTVEYKEDSSPLTEADQKAHEIITEGLQNLRTPNSELRTPDLPILSEEGRDIPYEERREWEYYWCIDPIDGTKEFIKKNGEFTINIALIHKETPVLGVVYAPALGEIYWAKKEEGAWKAPVNNQWSIVEDKEKRL
ncbi:3'(2'),5'-bisphosphate nucleotidase CysQ family protein, partial [Hydrogenimonas sp.]